MTTFDRKEKKISVEMFMPPTVGLYPAVVVAYGTAGMGILFDGHDVGAAIRDFAGYLAKEGFVALIPHYFESTKTPEGLETVTLAYNSANRDEWVDTLGACLKFAADRPAEIDKNRLALLGFSLGGYLCLRQAKTGLAPAVRAVVDFYAPISKAPYNGLGDHLEALPPVQIHHGATDQVVPKTQSDELERLLGAIPKRKGDERHDYPGEAHGFRKPDSIRLSKERTVAFLNRNML